jgi:hypothetical protein
MGHQVTYNCTAEAQVMLVLFFFMLLIMPSSKTTLLVEYCLQMLLVISLYYQLLVMKPKTEGHTDYRLIPFVLSCSESV